MIGARQICELDCPAEPPLELNRLDAPLPETLVHNENGAPPQTRAGSRELSMTESLENLVESLREELKNYGEMLALLDRQQEYLLTRAASEVSNSISRVEAQGAAIHEARQRREIRRRAVAKMLSQAEETSFAELIPLLPMDYQPLLKALVDENNELLFRVRRRAAQNHLMLKRSVELMQQVLNSLGLPKQSPACSNRGKLPTRVRVARLQHEEAN